MSMEKIRSEFEVWALTHFINSDSMQPLVRDEEEPEEYRYSRVNMAWVAWQASRAALVIELPPVRPEPASSGDELKAEGEAAAWNIWVGEKLAKADCREAIEAAGVKVKP